MAERKARIYVSSQFAGILFENEEGYVFDCQNPCTGADTINSLLPMICCQ